MIDQKLLLKGDIRQLAKAITLVESKNPEHRVKAQDLLTQIHSHTGKSIRIGISGVPGVGKSTFIESFGLELIRQGKKVAVLAVDPSSPISGGSIMGDKTRMEKLSQNEKAFIRPSPTAGALGGVANRTRESMLLCEAAGFDVILIETVGVGQSEYEVASMVDFFLVLMLPNAGDELQGIKKGILELCHTLVVNKADGEAKTLAQIAKGQYESALKIVKQDSFWQPQVATCSALNHQGIGDIWKIICDYVKKSKDQNLFDKKRSEQNIKWMEHLVFELLKEKMHADPIWEKSKQDIAQGKTTAFQAAQKILKI